jgi:hypothetical protein
VAAEAAGIAGTTKATSEQRQQGFQAKVHS